MFTHFVGVVILEKYCCSLSFHLLLFYLYCFLISFLMSFVCVPQILNIYERTRVYARASELVEMDGCCVYVVVCVFSFFSREYLWQPNSAGSIFVYAHASRSFVLFSLTFRFCASCLLYYALCCIFQLHLCISFVCKYVSTFPRLLCVMLSCSIKLLFSRVFWTKLV